MSLFQWKLHFRHDLLENQKSKVKKNLSVLFISDTVNYGIALNLLPSHGRLEMLITNAKWYNDAEKESKINITLSVFNDDICIHVQL